jgi:nucleotide-binding universal stress UspA family protein
MAHRIAVALDGSRFSEHGIPLARGIAERGGGELDLVTVAVATPEEGGVLSAAPGDVGSRDFWIERASTYLAGEVRKLREEGFLGDVRTSVLSPGNAAQSILQHLEAEGADLVVLTTHGRGPWGRSWLGSTADAVLRGSTCPVLLVRPSESSGETEDASVLPRLQGSAPAAERILVPLDGSDISSDLLKHLPLVQSADAELLLLRVVPPFIPGGSPYLPHALRDAEDHDRVVAHAKASLEAVAAKGIAGVGRVIPLVMTAGQPASAILEVAREWEVDLIAMSTSGRGGVARLLLGSVADKVIRGAFCPVLLNSAAPEAR